MTVFYVSSVAFSAAALALAGLVLVGGRRWANVLLALYLAGWSFSTDLAHAVIPAAWWHGEVIVWTHVATWAVGPAVLFVYVAFLGAALPTPIARPFGQPPVRAALLLVAIACAALGLTLLRADFAPTGGDGSWRSLGAGERTAVLALLATTIVGPILALDALRRAPPGSATRRRMRAYCAAFLLFDGGQALFFAATPVQAETARATLTSLGNFASVIGLALLARALLRDQLFDFDLRVKRGVQKSVVAGVFLAAFLIVAQLVQNYTSTTFGVVGGALAAGLALFALRPIERAADRLADAAMPRVHDTAEYRTVRKREVYRAALESALEDGAITERERGVLATLAAQLGLDPREAYELERDVRGTST